MTDKGGGALAARYGAWAVIAGGSDGLGAEIAREAARGGMNCLLVARRQGPLDALAEDIRREQGVEVRTLSLDLAAPDAAARLDEASAALDLGLVVFNAGAESSGAFFADAPFSEWRDLLQRNVMLLTEALHRFARRLRAKGRGAMLIVGSRAAFGGGARGAMYTASKGYALNLGESLWAELKPQGVDVLTFLFAIADTPSLRRVLDEKGIPIEATGATDPVELARAAVAALADGPVCNFDEEGPDDRLTSNRKRREHVMQVSASLQSFYAPGE